MKKHAVVYPFNKEFSPVIRYRELLADYEIRGVVSPSGFGLSGKPCGMADGTADDDFTITENFDDSLRDIDAVIFCDALDIHTVDSIRMDKIRQTAITGKDVVCTCTLPNERIDELVRQCALGGGKFHYFGSTNRTYSLQQFESISERLFPLDTPVVVICGISEQCNKFDLQLSFRKHAKEFGYAITQVGTRSYCPLFGFHAFPEFMFSRNLLEHEKVVLFNHYIKRLEEVEQPDLIIIGIPGGILPFNEMFSNRFGLLASEVTSAVRPDAVILASIFNRFTSDYYGRMQTMMKYRLNAEVDCFHLSNTYFNPFTSNDERRCDFSTYDVPLVESFRKEYENLTVPVFNVLNNDDGKSIVKYIIDILNGFQMAEAI